MRWHVDFHTHVRASAAHKMRIRLKLSISVQHTYDIQFAIPLTHLSFHNVIAIASHKVKVYFQYYTYNRIFPCILACVNGKVVICQSSYVWQQWTFDAADYTFSHQVTISVSNTNTHRDTYRLSGGCGVAVTANHYLAMCCINWRLAKPFSFSWNKIKI